MITFDELVNTISTKLAEKNLSDISRDITNRSWDKIVSQLAPHYEPVPVSGGYVDEYGMEQQDYEYELVSGCAETYDEDIAAMCWELGCAMGHSIDYWTGEISYSITLPETEEEYQRNIEEYKEWESENFPAD